MERYMRRSARLWTLLLVSTLPVMTGAALSPALPTLEAVYQNGSDTTFWIQWSLTTPALFTAVGAPLAGVLIDRVGRRPILLGALGLFSVSGVAGGLVVSLPVLLGTRALLGLAAGGVATVATTLVVDYYGDDRSGVLGWQAAIMAAGAMAYTVLGGALTDLSWRGPFALHLLGVLILVPAYWWLPEPGGTAESTPATGDGTDPLEPGVPWLLIGGLYGVAFLSLAVFNLLRVHLPYYLEAMGLQSGVGLGAVLSVGTVTGVAASMGYERVTARLGYRGTLAVLLGLFAAGFAGMAGASGVPVVVGGIVVAGGGMGLLVPLLNDWVGERAPAAARGRILGALSTLRNLGRFASPLLAQPLVAGYGPSAPFATAALAMAALALGVGGWYGATYLPRSLRVWLPRPLCPSCPKP
jgi:MFS family permease